MRNICFVTPHKPAPTETFIRAHMERIRGKIFHLYSYGLDYSFNGRPLRELYVRPRPFWYKFLHLLPYYFVFRFYKKKTEQESDLHLARRFLKENDIQLVFAEFGTAGAVVTPVCASLNIPLMVYFLGFESTRLDIVDEFRERYVDLFRYAFCVFVVAHQMKQDVIKLGCPEHKIIYNPCVPHPDYLNIIPNYFSNTLLAIGRQTFKKAPYLTILAFSRVVKVYPELRLVMIGEGEVQQVNERVVHALKLEDQVEFRPFQTREQILEQLGQTLMFVQHSLMAENGDSEGTPVAILDAMACGLPVVSTRHYGIRDIVVEGETGLLCDEGDVDTMTAHMLKLAGDRELARKLGENGRQRVQKEYTMERHIEIIEEQIDRALAHI